VGGLDLTTSAYDINDNEGSSPDLLNVRSNLAGAILKRDGTRLVNPTFGAFSGSTSIIGAQGFLPPAIFVAGSATTYILNPTTGVSSAFKTGLTANTKWSFVQAPTDVGGSSDSFVLGVNGVDPPQAYNSVVAAVWAKTSGAIDVPNGTEMLYGGLASGGYIYMTGTSAFPAGTPAAAIGDDPRSRVYRSARGNPFNWDPASNQGAAFMDFDPDDGQPIIGLGTVGPYVLVFKPEKTWAIIDMGTGSARSLSNSIGSYAPRSIQGGPGPTFFLSRDRGVYTTNGSSFTPVSDKVLPGLTSYQEAPAIYHNYHYYVSQGAVVFDYDLVLGSWWRHNFTYPIKDFTEFSDLLYAVDDHGNVIQLFTGGADYGGNVSWHWYSPWQSPSFYRRRRFATPYYRKRLRQVRIRCYGKVGFTASYNFGADALKPDLVFTQDALTDSELPGFVPSAAGVPGLAIFRGFGVGNVFQMKFSGADQQPVGLIEYTLMINDRSDMIPA
jgi:hypothetical protein